MHRPATRNPASRSVRALSCAVLLAAMTACGSDDDGNRASTDGDDDTGGTASGLPRPEGAIGSVTGMPATPGPGTAPITSIEPAASGATGASDASGVAGATAVGAASGLQRGVQAVDPQDIQVLSPEEVAAALADDVPDVPPVPRPPQPEVAPAPPDYVVPEPPSRVAEPVGTEAATESTTIVVEPDDTGG